MLLLPVMMMIPIVKRRMFICSANLLQRHVFQSFMLRSLTANHLPGGALGGVRSRESLLHSLNKAKSSEADWPVGGTVWPSAERGPCHPGLSGGELEGS